MIEQEQLIQALKLNGVDSTSSLESVDVVLNLFHYSAEDKLKTIEYLRTQGWTLATGTLMATPVETVLEDVAPITVTTSPVIPVSSIINPVVATVPIIITPPVVPVASVPQVPVQPVPIINPFTGSIPVPTLSVDAVPAPKMTYVPPAGSTGTVPSISVAPTQGSISIPVTPAVLVPSANTTPASIASPVTSNSAVVIPVQKDSYGTAIFLVVIIFVLILGGIVGYAYVNGMGPFEKPAPAAIQGVLQTN